MESIRCFNKTLPSSFCNSSIPHTSALFREAVTSYITVFREAFSEITTRKNSTLNAA